MSFRSILGYCSDRIGQGYYRRGFLRLKQILDTLDKYKIKLNPNKCVFRVKAGKFLGFMILYRGIEANLEKMEAILNMKTPNHPLIGSEVIFPRSLNLGQLQLQIVQLSLLFFNILSQLGLCML